MKLALLLSFILFSSVALAQAVDRAILVSDITSADMLIAKVAAQKAGAPVFVLENGTLTDDVAAELARLNIRTVILVGGPAVISTDTENMLDGKYTVVRLWGSERTGTAIEVAKYFWIESQCAVLADDTKDSETDTELQADASQIAAAEGCVFLPVPKGKVPAEVASLLGDLGVSERKEITDRSAAESGLLTALENRTKRLIIIAAPHWKHAMSLASNAERHALVRIVSSAESVPRLAELINGKNITDVRVLGHPALAADIASELNALGINVTKISGERASEVAIKAVRESWSEWQQRRKEAFGNETNVFAKNKIKKQVTALLNRLERDLNRLEAGIDKNANATASAILKSKIDNAQSQLGAIRDYITNDNLDTAKKRIARLHSEVRAIRWLYRMQLNVDTRNDVTAEES